MSISRSKCGLMTLVIVALASGGCSKKEKYADTTVIAAPGDTSGMAAGTLGPSSNWTDENIFALLDEANMSDSAGGAIAATKGTASTVRDFGKQMMRDHHQLRVRGEALAKKLKVTPTPPSDDPVMSDSQKHMDVLNSTAKGKDFDKAYIDGEVDIHKKVLETAVEAAGQTQNTELKNLIQKAAPVIQGHLDRAEAIQKALK
jgi:putative membrane protein